ncbi:PGF-CTERM sorting domain-containing protein [Halorarius halobius]|uniref:PGF-CTERM sorting domain-containing protein n=1 Tax=Halorarius halobius TaxID=2962671 RepID=UPI0020CD373F|nr:PGF-CTERM sorting domain-containing protein [Halorarius halobius]
MARNATVTALVTLLVVTSMAAMFGGTAAADHGQDSGNYTVNLPFDSDHYPRDKNPGGPANASINHYAGFTREQLENRGAKLGVEELDWIIVESQDISFSECKTENTAAFGIDRDSDDPGTKTDVDLLQYRKYSAFKEHSIVLQFFDGDELASPSPEDKGGPGEKPWKEGQGREDGDGNAEVYPDDQIVAHQGYKSGGGACYKMPKEPGWYQIHAYGNGTAFNGNRVKIDYMSHYFYICKCDSEQEAVETLGPPPSAESSGSTPTPTATPDGSTATQTATQTATATPEPADTPTPSPTPQQATPTATQAPAQGGGGGGGSSGGGGGGNTDAGSGGDTNAGGGQQDVTRRTATDGSVPVTPTVAEGPGFGAAAALVALVGAAVVALRRTW